MPTRPDNRINTSNGYCHKPTFLRKQPADSVPFGEQISERGGYVWCAFEDETLRATAATADEARRRFNKIMIKVSAERIAARKLLI